MDTLMQFAYVLSGALFIFGLKQLGSPRPPVAAT